SSAGAVGAWLPPEPKHEASAGSRVLAIMLGFAFIELFALPDLEVRGPAFRSQGKIAVVGFDGFLVDHSKAGINIEHDGFFLEDADELIDGDARLGGGVIGSDGLHRSVS